MEQTRQLSKRSIHKIVRGAIKEAIHLHGDITPQLVESVAKRAAGHVYWKLQTLMETADGNH